jgi:predicted NUDIX family NTP pyrophosphohydrolase
MAPQSAGILLYRKQEPAVEVFLVHPGGPFWKKKDDGAWTIPKGVVIPGEDVLQAAKREFNEETGFKINADCLLLGTVHQSGGKDVTAFAVEMDVAPAKLVSNNFMMEWPPKSGRLQEFPEVDRGDWFTLDAAAIKILKGQRPLLEMIQDIVLQKR